MNRSAIKKFFSPVCNDARSGSVFPDESFPLKIHTLCAKWHLVFTPSGEEGFIKATTLAVIKNKSKQVCFHSPGGTAFFLASFSLSQSVVQLKVTMRCTHTGTGGQPKRLYEILIRFQQETERTSLLVSRTALPGKNFFLFSRRHLASFWMTVATDWSPSVPWCPWKKKTRRPLWDVTRSCNESTVHGRHLWRVESRENLN